MAMADLELSAYDNQNMCFSKFYSDLAIIYLKIS